MKHTILIFIFLNTFLSFTQKEYRLSFRNFEVKEIVKKPKNTFKDSTEAINYLRELKLIAIKKGYLLASVDSLFFLNSELKASLYLGDKFNKTNISIEKQELNFLKKKGNIHEKLIAGLVFSPKEIHNLLVKIQSIYVNNGFPFCKIYLREIKIDKGILNANLIIEKLGQYKITKINMVGDPLISKKLIASYILIKEGDYFNQEKINEISSKLKQISFVNEVKPSEILFTNEGVELFLYIKAKPVSLINGVVGLQPDPIKNKLFLTGELRLKLVNVLKKAELFDLNWRNIQAQTQSLKIQGTLPNLFQTSFGLDGQFQLYKKDTSFIEIKSTIGVQYALKQGSFLKAFYRKNNSSLLNSGKSNKESFKTVETNFYGLSLSKQNLDYLPNPRKGVSILLEATIGNRVTKDSLQSISETTYKFEINLQWFIPLTKRNVLRIGNFSESYFAPVFFQNEVYRFGGQISLRGFNEEEIFATSRSVTSLEYRFLLDQNSYLFAFFDQAWYENKASKFVTDTPFGFGAGFTFGTNIGNFAVSYALGRQFSNEVLFRDGKIHFGYIAYF